MGNFNRDRGGRPGGGRGFNDRGSWGSVEMHQAVCGKCGKNCEVPFRPTGERPVFCSNCFENNRGSEERQMFSAVCADCGNSCQVPFQPSNGKPVFCSNCFGDKKEGGNKRREQSNSQPQYEKQFEQLNNKLDRILTILTPNIVAEVKNPEPVEEIIDTEKKTKVAKKKPSK